MLGQWQQADFYVMQKFQLPFWFNADYTIDIIFAVMTYFAFYAINNKTAFVWFMFYDSIYEISNFPVIPLNALAVLIFMLAMFCFIIFEIPIKNKIPIIISFALIWLATMALHSASFYILEAWSIFLILSQLF